MTIDEETILKYVKYGKNPIKFIEDYSFGVSRINGKLDFLSIQKFQTDVINDIHKNNYIVIKKTRQMYISYTVCAYIAWCMIFKCDFNIAIVSYNKNSAINNVDKIRLILQKFYNDTTGWENELIVNKKSEIRLRNGSFVHAFAPTKDAGRGYRIDLLFIDDFAHIKYIEEVWFGLGMCLHNGKAIIASTPKIAGDFFNKLWDGSISKENSFHPINLNWTMNPHYTKMHEIRNNKPWSPWFENQCYSLGNNQDMIDSELWGMFVSGVRPDASKRINFRINGYIYDKIINKIDEQNISLSDYMKKLIEKDLGI